MGLQSRPDATIVGSHHLLHGATLTIHQRTCSSSSCTDVHAGATQRQLPLLRPEWPLDPALSFTLLGPVSVRFFGRGIEEPLTSSPGDHMRPHSRPQAILGSRPQGRLGALEQRIIWATPLTSSPCTSPAMMCLSRVPTCPISVAAERAPNGTQLGLPCGPLSLKTAVSLQMEPLPKCQASGVARIITLNFAPRFPPT